MQKNDYSYVSDVIGKRKLRNILLQIGYSGHEEHYVLTLGAVALGARIVERHFTLDNSMKGSDHSWCQIQKPILR